MRLIMNDDLAKDVAKEKDDDDSDDENDDNDKEIWHSALVDGEIGRSEK